MIKQKQLDAIQSSQNQEPQQEAERLLNTITAPQKPVKPEFVSLYQRMSNEAIPFAMSIVRDYIELFRLFGQSIAGTDKILSTELIFVEKTEQELEPYSNQSFSNPLSPTYKAISAKVEENSV